MIGARPKPDGKLNIFNGLDALNEGIQTIGSLDFPTIDLEQQVTAL